MPKNINEAEVNLLIHDGFSVLEERAFQIAQSLPILPRDISKCSKDDTNGEESVEKKISGNVKVELKQEPHNFELEYHTLIRKENKHEIRIDT